MTVGPHSEAFAHRLGKSHFLGLRVNPGQVWVAKGRSRYFLQDPSSQSYSVIDFITQSILKYAKPIAEQYREGDYSPDPSFVLQLPDETVTASNLFAVQKFFDGEFQFDVFFDSASSPNDLDCVYINRRFPAY